MLNENTLTQLSKNLEEPNWLLQQRLDALKKFNNTQLSTFKYGMGISIDISELNLESINPLDNKNTSTIIYPNQAEVLPLSKALKKYPEIVKKYFMAKAELNTTKFTALHKAFFTDGILIFIPANTMLETPIQLSLDLQSKTRIENILVMAGKNSKAKIIETSKSGNISEQIFRSQIVEIIAEENANLDYISVQALGKSAYNFSIRKALLKENAFVNWTDCTVGGKFAQTAISTSLEGIGARSKTNWVVFGDKTQCFDINNTTLHTASKTVSNMAVRVVLNNSAKAIYRGLIKISPNAVNCEGYQKDDTVLLSDEAQADVVPNLEISNNEVKCSHGATISQIDDDKLFYLMSRGLNTSAAKKAIVEGFFNPIIAKIESPEVKEDIINSISERLEAV